MENSKTVLSCCTNELVQVNTKRRMLQGDFLSPLLFLITLISLTVVCRAAKLGYLSEKGRKDFNHMLFLDDVMLYSSSTSS